MIHSTVPERGPITAASFARLARQRLWEAPPLADPKAGISHPSDFDLSPSNWDDLMPGLKFRPAAVLVPIIARPEPTVLLTLRTTSMPNHAGQISFPGGTTDETDIEPLDTALREAREEIGLEPLQVEPLGYLDVYRSGTGFLITPVVALVAPDPSLVLNASEVESVFEVPLGFLMDPKNHSIEARLAGGRERLFYAMPHHDRYIWGITAGILRNLYERVVRP